MPAVNRRVVLRPTSASETNTGGAAHWSSVTTPEGTLQAGDTSLIVKALTAPIDGGGVPWSYNGAAPSIAYGLVRPPSIAPGATVELRAFLPSLSADPNEYISAVTLRWRGSLVSSGSSGANLTSILRVVAVDAPGGADVGDWVVPGADITALGAAGSTTNWWSHTIATPFPPTVQSREKDLYMLWRQSNVSGSSQSGWNLVRAEVEVELSLKSPVRSVC